MAKHEEVKNGVIFPIGEKNDAAGESFLCVYADRKKTWSEPGKEIRQQ